MADFDVIELSMVKRCTECGADTDASIRKRPTRSQRARYDAVLHCIRCDALVGYVFSAAEIEQRQMRLALHDAMTARLRDISATLQSTSTNRRASWS